MIITALLTLGCKSSDTYTLVSEEETIELLRHNQIDFMKLSYKDQNGAPITDSLRTLLNQGKLVRYFYKNRDGVVDQVRLRTTTDENIFFSIRVGELQQDPFWDIDFAKLDCEDSEAMLRRALDRDQGVRKGLIDDIQTNDKLNRDTIISVLDQCEWPDTKDEVEAIWYVIQHAGGRKMAFYYPEFKDMVQRDLLEDSLMAKMEDRMLMFNGYPQIYGTQFTSNPRTFHEIKDIKNVNERRRKVGLVSIEEKAKSAGVDFNWSDYLVE